MKKIRKIIFANCLLCSLFGPFAWLAWAEAQSNVSYLEFMGTCTDQNTWEDCDGIWKIYHVKNDVKDSLNEKLISENPEKESPGTFQLFCVTNKIMKCYIFDTRDGNLVKIIEPELIKK